MQVIELFCNPFESYTTYGIGGRNTTRIDSLNQMLWSPLFIWADKFFDIVQDYMNDDFEVLVHSLPFEERILRCLGRNSASCKGIKSEPFEFDKPVSDRISEIKAILHGNGIESIPVFPKLQVFIAGNLKIGAPYYAEALFAEDAQAIICDEGFDYSTYSGKLVLIPSEEESVCFRNENYVFRIPVTEFEEVAGEYYESIVLTKYLQSLLDIIERVSADLNDAERTAVMLAKRIEPLVIANDIPVLDAGSSWDLTYSVFPDGCLVDDVRVVCDGDAVEIDGLHVLTRAVGNCKVKFYRGNRTEPFGEKDLKVKQDVYVSEIIFETDSTSIAVGSEHEYRLKLLPDNAVDSGSARIFSSDPGIVEVRNGCIRGVGAGHASITVSTENAERTIHYDVIPYIQEIMLSSKDISLPVGRQAEIRIGCFPERVFDNTILIQCTDPTIADVKTDNWGNTFITGKRLGECVLSFMAEKGDAVQRCRVEVYSTFNRRNRF